MGYNQFVYNYNNNNIYMGGLKYAWGSYFIAVLTPHRSTSANIKSLCKYSLPACMKIKLWYTIIVKFDHRSVEMSREKGIGTKH